MKDSTFQAVSYWNKGEKQKYIISEEKIKIKGTDTASKEITSYEVEILVLDSTENTYTIQWTYLNLKTNSSNEIIQKLMNINKDMKLIYKIDDVGTFIEVVNWKEIKEFIHTSMAVIKNEMKSIPEIEKVFNQIEKMYSSREAIESAAIKDIQQFHSFHGGKYKLGETIEGKLQLTNIFGGKPFDADMTVFLDEINIDENNAIVRSTQEINKEQLTNATYEYLKKMAENMKIDGPKREDLKDLKNETLTASRIHGSGWIVYSVQTTTINAGEQTNIEERIIEIK